MANFAKRWFHASGTAITPTKLEGATVPKIVALLHDHLTHGIYEYQWSEIGKNGGPVNGWFQPTSVHAADVVSALDGVVLLPALTDPGPVGDGVAKLYGHANVLPTDNGYTFIKKLCTHHQTAKDAHRHAGLRPELY